MVNHKEKSTFICIACDVLVCDICMTGKHKEHTFSKLADDIARLRGENENQIYHKTDENSLISFDNAVEPVIKAITDESSKIKSMFNESVAEMSAEVKTHF